MPKAPRQKLSKTKLTDKSQKLSANIPTDDIAAKPVVNKAVKKKQRHEAWLEKLDHSYATKKKQQKKANKKGALNKGFDDFGDILQMIQKETPITADQAVSSATGTATTTATPSTPGSHIISTNKIKSKKAKKAAMMQEIVRFQKVMQHDAFKQDPLSTIRQHVQNSFT
ncbi:ribosome biogenesis protein SLX9-domain-containing protein [Absidia repens]|uniref:Ribosome biogenesis protein SLX9 n=1 Tax=Absidia repens TaxID=90262 RepID=A0A1X2IP55_9FUNG|nr:ribosome biogenesis protein SLX9-domain-containing protein [Absidia repens]